MNSHRINGARVKAAARAHALKQLRHFGVSFHDGAGSTTFKGQTAFASWTEQSSGLLQSFRINYPALPDNAMLSRREADLIAAYTLHELGHIAHTDNSVTRGEQLVLFKLWNGIEDARIEHAVIASGKARGARSMFKKLMSKYTTTHLGDQFNPTSINSAPFTLALVCRAAYGDGNGFAKSLLARIPEPYQSWYAAAAAGVVQLSLDRSGSRGALSLAREFLAAWLAAFPDALARPEQPQEPQQQPQDSGDDDSDDSDEQLSDFGDDDESGDDGDSPYGNESASDDDLDDGSDDFEPVAGDRWDDDAHERDDDTDGVSRDQLEQDAADATEAAPESNDGLFDGVGDDADDGDDGSAGGDGGGSFEPVENDCFDEQRCLAPEPNVDDVFANARQRTKAPIDLPGSVSPARSDMSKWRNLIDKDETSIKRSFKRLKKSALPALKAQLYRILKAPEVCGWDSGALGGRFDGKRAPRMFAGSEQVFKRRWLSEGIDTAVSIVIDLSSSMNGGSISAAVDLAFTIADACESARADVEVLGFKSNGYYGRNSGGYGLDGSYADGEYNSTATLVVAKRFNQKLAKVAHHFGFLKKIASGGTPDYTAVKGVCEQLSQMPHQRKVVIVITDGLGESQGYWYDETQSRPRTDYHMKKLSDASQQLYGCDVIGFGIYCNAREFADAYPIGAPVTLDNIGKSTLKGVIKQLELRDDRRVA